MPSKPDKLWPMPVNGLFLNPRYVALPAAGRGMLLSLCEHFWRTACKPLPRDDDQLFAIARAHRPTWRVWKATILVIFHEIEPELSGYHRQREGMRQGLRTAAQMSTSTQRLNALRDSLPANPGPALSIPAQQQARPATPAKAPRRVMVDRRR